jgi:hypothetical protein
MIMSRNTVIVSILILSSHLRLDFCSGYVPLANTVYGYLVSSVYTSTTRLSCASSYNCHNNIWQDKKVKSFLGLIKNDAMKTNGGVEI